MSNYCKNCYELTEKLERKEQECEELKAKIKYMKEYIKTVENARNELEKEPKNKIKEVKNVLSISYDLWMYHIANGVGNSDNKNAVEALEDFSVAIRLLADTLGESEGYLSHSTNESKVYKIRKEQLQKLNEVQNGKQN